MSERELCTAAPGTLPTSMTPSSERLPATELRRRMSGRLAPATVVLLALAVYVATLMPGQAFDDWGEAQTVPHVLGVAHPTGYPTYILAAWLFELMPLGSVAWRANLLSAVCVAIALGALTAIGQRLGVRPWLAALAALATGAVATFWTSAVVAEVNPLHLALMALLIHRSLVWSDEGRARDLGLSASWSAWASATTCSRYSWRRSSSPTRCGPADGCCACIPDGSRGPSSGRSPGPPCTSTSRSRRRSIRPSPITIR